MKMRWVLPLLIAVLAGLGFLVVLDQVINEARQTEPAEPMVPAVVATMPLDVSREVSEEFVELKRVYASMVPEGHFSDVQSVIGRVLRSHVPVGYPITEACLQPHGTLAGFDSKIPSGYRAYSIKVEEWSSVAGFVVPGSRVDVIADVTDRITRRSKSRTILQNVQVAAVGAATSREDLSVERGDPRANKADRRLVTLFLTPREVEIMHEAKDSRLTLSLRSGADDSRYVEKEEPVESVVAAHAPLLALPAKPVEEKKPEKKQPEPVKPEKFVTWEIHGDQIEQVTYVRINGVWQRENSANAYPGSELPQAPPLLKLQTAQPSVTSDIPPAARTEQPGAATTDPQTEDGQES